MKRIQPSWRAETEIFPAFAGFAKLRALGGAASAWRKNAFLYCFQKITCRPAEALLSVMGPQVSSEGAGASQILSTVSTLYLWGNDLSCQSVFKGNVEIWICMWNLFFFKGCFKLCKNTVWANIHIFWLAVVPVLLWTLNHYWRLAKVGWISFGSGWKKCAGTPSRD